MNFLPSFLMRMRLGWSVAKLRMAARQWQTAFWSLCHTEHCMVPSPSRYNERNWRRLWAKWEQSKTKCLSSPLSRTQTVAAELPGDERSSKPALLHRQSMGPHAELHQQLQPGNGHRNIKIWHSFQLSGAAKPCRTCAMLGPFDWSLGC